MVSRGISGLQAGRTPDTAEDARGKFVPSHTLKDAKERLGTVHKRFFPPVFRPLRVGSIKGLRCCGTTIIARKRSRNATERRRHLHRGYVCSTRVHT